MYDVTDSHTTSISCLERLRTSAAKEMPTASGGSHEDCSIDACGVWLKAVQLLTTRSMALSMSKAKRYRLVTVLSWWLQGWLSWICKAVSNPSRTCLGTIMHSLEQVKGSSRLTTNKPFFAIVATFRYRLISLTLVSFFDGLIPLTRCACVRLRSLVSYWMASQDARVVKGNLAWPWRMFWIEVWRTTDSWVR